MDSVRPIWPEPPQSTGTRASLDSYYQKTLNCGIVSIFFRDKQIAAICALCRRRLGSRNRLWFLDLEHAPQQANCDDRTLFQPSAYIVSRSAPDSRSTARRRSLWVSNRHDHAKPLETSIQFQSSASPVPRYPPDGEGGGPTMTPWARMNVARRLDICRLAVTK